MMAGLYGASDQDPELSQGSPPAPKQITQVRACTNCVRAKSKCSPSNDIDGRCDRCHRMNKNCVPSPPMRKRRMMKMCAENETSRLEHKLDGLFTLLKSSTQVARVAERPPIISTPLELHSLSHDDVDDIMSASDLRHYEQVDARTTRHVHDYGHSVTPIASSSASSRSTLVNAQTALLHPSLQPSPQDAELYLDRFRADFAKHLPFIVISPSVTSYQLCQESPILWVCIMTVASNKSTQQIALSKETRAIFGQEAFVRKTKNMDLLLAILVYITWDHQHSMDKPIFLTLLHFATAILYELGLDKASSSDPSLVLANDMKGVARQPPRPQTLEERRAWLGLFMLSSRSTAIMRKGDTLSWTAYSDECLRVIETQNELASDALLVQQVRLRLISERVKDLPWSRNTTTHAEGSASPPATVYIRSLDRQLQEFKTGVPAELLENKTLLMEIHDTTLQIHEISLSHSSEMFGPNSNQRLESLYACLNTASSWVSIFLAIQPAQYVGLPTSTFAQFVHLFVTIYRLATLEDPSWNRQLVRETIDVTNFLEVTERNFLLVKDAAGLDKYGSDDVDIFSIFAVRIKVFKKWWAGTNLDGSAGTLGGEKTADLNMEFLNEEWLRDMLGSWNE